ncbi:MAG: hypothetical protein FJ291_07110 [Planctomycetes bacterium]|nr:hypothetical protein [Planctomycetota bacterium]
MALRSFLQTSYGLSQNPFPGNATYGEDTQRVYVPEMFGPQRQEFLRKFVLAPLETGQPLIGAVWSVVPGDPQARGFGKSTLMGEEAKLMNRDFGHQTLTSLGVESQDARENPVLASYVSFNVRAQGGIANIDAAAFHLTRFMLRSDHERGASVHQCLRELAAARLLGDGKAREGDEGDAIIEAIRERFRRLSVPLDIRNLLEDYVFHLASPDTTALQRFLADEVGTWHHDRNGLKYLQLFVAFAELAGIKHFTFFIDQVEDFTASAGAAKLQKNVKIIRDALIETEPFASLASFVFQFHPDAYERLRDAWLHEDLRPLEWDNPLNGPYVVVLKGLENYESARLLAERCLNHETFAVSRPVGGIAPFTDSSLRKVWEHTKPRPRWFLRVLHDLLHLGSSDRVALIDDAYVAPKLEGLSAEARSVEATPSGSDDRLG